MLLVFFECGMHGAKILDIISWVYLYHKIQYRKQPVADQYGKFVDINQYLQTYPEKL